MDRDPFDLVGDVLDGQFRVDAFAGEGDLSVVYKGHHLGVDAPIAIKCLNLPATLDPSHGSPLVDGFKDASRIHYRLARGNLNIAQSIASGTTVAPRTGTVVPYVVREWFEGESLAADLARRREQKATGRSVTETMTLLEAAFDGISYAHLQGEVHLSLNPSNLFLATKPEGGASIKVLDFGVASAMNDVSTKSANAPSPPVSRRGLRVLFPAYAAPEQLDQAVGPQGAWTDVYALALITLEVLSDRLVMAEQDNGALIEHALDERRRPNPQAHGLKLPRNLELVLTRAVLRAPDRRPKNAAELWRDLKSAVKPTLSRPNQAAVGVVGALGEHAGAPLSPATLVPAHTPVPPPQAAPAARAAPAPAITAAPPPAVPAPAVTPPAAAQPVAPSPAAPSPAAPAVPRETPSLAEPVTASRPRAATLMGIAGPAVVVGAVGNRLKLPSTPSVETQPMSFEPSSRANPFEVEAVTIPRKATLPASGPVPGASQVPTPSPPPAAASVDPTRLPPVASIGEMEDDSSPAAVPHLPAAFAPTEPAPPMLPSVPPEPTPINRARIVGRLAALGVVLAALAGFAIFQKHAAKAAAAVNATPTALASAPGESRTAASAPALVSVPVAASDAPLASALSAEPAASASAAPGTASAAAPATTAPFNAAAAKKALEATSHDVAKCKRGKLWGVGSATVSFANDGSVAHAAVGAPFKGTPGGDCVEEALTAVHVAPFKGVPATLNHRFFVPIK